MIRDASGSLHLFSSPGAGVTSPDNGTVPTSINNSGQIVGFSISPYVEVSFLESGDQVTNFHDPLAAAFGGTFAAKINARGAIAGSYVDPQNIRHGFFRDVLPPN